MSTLRILSTGDPIQGDRATQFASTRGATQYRVGFCSIREFKLHGVDYSVRCDVADSGTGPYFMLTLGGDVFKGLTPTAVVRDLCEFLGIDLIRPVAQFIGLNKSAASPLAPTKRARGALDADPDAIVPSGPRSRRRAALSARKTTMMLLDHTADDDDVDDDARADDDLGPASASAPFVDAVESPAADDDAPLSRRRRIVRDDGDVADEVATPTGDETISHDEEFVSSRRGGSSGGSSRRGGSLTRAPRKKAAAAAATAAATTSTTTTAAAATTPAADQEGEQSGGGDEEQYDAMAQSGQARSDGGLRSFASLVTRYVHSKAETTFADVADAVVGLVQSSDSIVNEHNARRRVYDVLNVLQSAGILRKEKKRVTWIGIDELNLGEAGKGDFVPEPIVKRVPAAAAAAAASSSAAAAQGGARAAAAAAAAAVAAELAKRKEEVRARIAAKERRVEQLYYFRIRLQNVMNRNGAIERACELVGKSTRDVERLRVPFLLVSTAASAVVDCDATEDHSEVVLRLSHAFCIADESVTLEAMHEKGLILRR